LEVAVTSDRFVQKSGLVAITTEEVSLDKIEEVNVDESILGRTPGIRIDRRPWNRRRPHQGDDGL
jgi:hypothetical protein